MIKGLTSIIIPIRNLDYPNAHYTGNCIGNIKYHTKAPYEIIIIDNASTVDLSSATENFQQAVDKYFRFDENKGVSKAWNKGIEISDGEFICIMNSDVEVYENWLDYMIESLNGIDVVMATPMYAYPYGRADRAKILEKEIIELKENPFSDFMDFSCFMFKSSMLDEIGLFDENIEIGWGEDIDFRFRCEEKGKIIKSNRLVNTHHIGMATGYSMMNHGEPVNEAMDKNREYIKQKWNLDENGNPAFRRNK